MATELEEKSQVKAKFSRDLATVKDNLMELATWRPPPWSTASRPC